MSAHRALGDRVGRVAVHPHDRVVRLAVLLVALVRAERRGDALLGLGAQRLRGLGAVAVDGQRLDAALPRLDVGVGDVLDA